jgi:hypothetical protein
MAQKAFKLLVRLPSAVSIFERAACAYRPSTVAHTIRGHSGDGASSNTAEVQTDPFTQKLQETAQKELVELASQPNSDEDNWVDVRAQWLSGSNALDLTVWSPRHDA